MASKTIYVYENWSSETPALLGCLYVDFFKNLELALATAELYNLKLSEAKNLIQDMAQVIRTNWKGIAEKYGLSRGSILHMEAAFER